MHKQPNNQTATASQAPLSPPSLLLPWSSLRHCISIWPISASDAKLQLLCFLHLTSLRTSSSTFSHLHLSLPDSLHSSTASSLLFFMRPLYCLRAHTHARASVMTGCAVVCVRTSGDATPSSVVHSTRLNGCLVLQPRCDGHHFRGMQRVWRKIKTSV